MSETGYSDELVARLVLDGDSEAFGILIDKYSRLVFSIALHYTRDRRDAKDLVQEVFLKAYKSLPEIRDFSKFDGWLARIALSESLNWLRDSAKLPIPMGDAKNLSAFYVPDPEPADPQIRLEAERKVWNGIERLPEGYRLVIMLKYFDGLSYSEIADILGVNVSTIRNRMFRAKSYLKRLLAGLIEQKPITAPDEDNAATA
jgi:RNA polymerase sigma-70 factor (ECF subfamily)